MHLFHVIIVLQTSNKGSRAKHNPVIGSTGAGKGASLIILRVAISIGASILEKLRKRSRPTVTRVTAILIGLEHRARVIAATRSPQLIRALPIDVRRASDASGTPTRVWAEFEWHVESIDQRNVEEVKIIELIQSILG